MIRFKMMPSAVLSCFVWVSMIASCSVKEDRGQCPCVLMLDLRRLDTVKVESVNVLAVSADGVVLNECVECQEFSEIYTREVPHGLLQVNVWSGNTSGTGAERIVHIPYGLECPPVYLHSFVADTRGEVCHEIVDLKKNYCMLTVKTPEGTGAPYSLTFKGGVDGYDVRGMPSAGEFSCVAYPGGDGDSRAVLPRQVDNSLMLEVDDGVPHLKKFALGEFLDKAGYDWSAPSLDDVTIVLDYSLTSVTVNISGWDKDDIYNVVL